MSDPFRVAEEARGRSFRGRLAEAGRSLKRELKVYRLVLRHEKTPWYSKALLAAAIGYALLPFDLIPDFLPVVGHLDDAIIIPALVVAARRGIPALVLAECRERVRRADAA